MTGWPPEEVRGEKGKNRGKIVEGMLESALMVHVSLVKERRRKEIDEMKEWECKKLHKKTM